MDVDKGISIVKRAFFTSDILNSRDFDKCKTENPVAKPLKYGPEMRLQWRKVHDEEIVPLRDELR